MEEERVVSLLFKETKLTAEILFKSLYFVAEKAITTLFDELLKNKELDNKLAKSTGNAKGFSSVKEFMLVSSR